MGKLKDFSSLWNFIGISCYRFRLHSFWPIWIWILRSKIRFFNPFHRNPILDCNPNDPPPEADRSDWYLKLVLDCSFHLINRFIDRILDCLITWTADQKSQGNLDPGTSVWKQIRFRIFCSRWSAIWSNFQIGQKECTLNIEYGPIQTKNLLICRMYK